MVWACLVSLVRQVVVAFQVSRGLVAAQVDQVVLVTKEKRACLAKMASMAEMPSTALMVLEGSLGKWVQLVRQVTMSRMSFKRTLMH